MNNETVMFCLPKTTEGVLAAISTIQDYVNCRRTVVKNHGIKEHEFCLSVDLVSGNPEIDYLFKALGHVNAMPPLAAMPMRSEYDLVIEFDVAAAYEMALPTHRHMVATFGLLLGLDPPTLPDVSLLLDSVTQPTRDILLLTTTVTPGDFPDHACDFASFHGEPEQSWIALLNTYHMVVGPRSGLTYLACCMGKMVVELYPTDRYRRWLSKWSHAHYAMVYHDNPPAEMVKRAVNALWEQGRALGQAV